MVSLHRRNSRKGKKKGEKRNANIFPLRPGKEGGKKKGQLFAPRGREKEKVG